jgi:NTP pyrophosphatase (non-canonical NTP hydrolase)
VNKITYDERKNTYEATYQKYGIGSQIVIAVEEMSELIKEICKIERNKGNMDNLAEEVADVTIMMEQLRLIYGINDAVCKQMDMKIRRLQDMLDE